MNIFKRKIKYNGIVPDTRPASEVAKDYTSFEVYGVAQPTNWKQVGINQWKKYLIRDQDGSGSCVSNTVSKMFEVRLKNKTGEILKFSHAPVYINRVNRPGSGMVGIDALQLAVKLGSCPEVNMPSEFLNDQQLDSLTLPSNFEALNDKARPTNYVILNNSFDEAARIIEKEGCIMIWVDTDYQNWCKDFPTRGGKGGGVRHSVTGIDAVQLPDGTKYIVIEDSWGTFGAFNGQRLLSKEFWNEAVFFTASLTNFTYSEQPHDAKFEPFTIQMEFGQTNNEIARMQDFLKARGLFPVNVASSGFYGPITSRAVYAAQIRWNVANMSELNKLTGSRSRVGPKTLAAFNKNL